MHHTSYIATPEEKQIDTHPKMEWQMYFLAENLVEFNAMVMNYKIRLEPIANSYNWMQQFTIIFITTNKLYSLIYL